MAPLITSLQNNRLKSLAKLHEAKYRKREQRVLIDGIREIQQALLGGVTIDELWYDPARFDIEMWLASVEQHRLTQTVLQPATGEVLQKLQFGDRSEGLVAIARTPNWTWEDVFNDSKPLLVILDGVEKPGNIGAVCRTAVAANFTAVVLSNCRCEAYNPNAIRSSLGLVFRIPLVVATASETIAHLKREGVSTYVARVQASTEPYALDWKGATAIVLGSEAEGLGGEWVTSELPGVRIPMDSRVDSLNVSVSAAILMYEAVRQRLNF